MDRVTRKSAALGIGGLATLMSLVLAPAASATYPDRNGLIAFHARTDSGLQIFTVRPNGLGLHQITHVDGDATGVDWSPNGRRLAFAINECTIAVMDADGRDLDVIADDPNLCQTDPSFTPDGRRIVYTRFDFALEVEAIWSMKTDGTDKKLVTGAGGPDPNVSPDGRRISFKAPPFGALYVQNIDGTGLHQVSPDLDVGYKHDWSPDGRRLVFSDNADPGPNDAVNVATVRADGTGLRYVTHYAAPDRAFVGGYSPDGRWIIFRLEHDGLATLYRIHPDGTGLRAILGPSTFLPGFNDWGPAVHGHR